MCNIGEKHYCISSVIVVLLNAGIHQRREYIACRQTAAIQTGFLMKYSVPHTTALVSCKSAGIAYIDSNIITR